MIILRRPAVCRARPIGCLLDPNSTALAPIQGGNRLVGPRRPSIRLVYVEREAGSSLPILVCSSSQRKDTWAGRSIGGSREADRSRRASVPDTKSAADHGRCDRSILLSAGKPVGLMARAAEERAAAFLVRRVIPYVDKSQRTLNVRLQCSYGMTACRHIAGESNRSRGMTSDIIELAESIHSSSSFLSFYFRAL